MQDIQFNLQNALIANAIALSLHDAIAPEILKTLEGLNNFL
jgi:hypothetical protein